MNTGIKKEPAFDVKQAIRKISENLQAQRTSEEGQDKMNLPTKLELYELLSPYGTTYKEIKEAYPQTVHDEEQVNLLDQEFDPTDSNMVNLYNQMMDLAFEKMEEKEKINPDDPSLTDYELYEIWSPYGARYRQIRKAHPTPEQEESIRKQAEEMMKNSPKPTLNYRASDSVYERSVMQGEGAFISPNLDLIEYLASEKIKLQEDLDQATLDFFGSVDTILAMCPKDSRLAKLGARLGYLLLAVTALRCVLDVQRRREQLINDLVSQGRERREAEAETLPIYHKWLLDEITTLVLEDWVSDVLPLIFIPQEDEENKESSII